MIASHSVSDAAFSALADGFGGPAAIEDLWRGQYSRRLLLLKLFVEGTGPSPETEAAVAAIVAAEERDPSVRAVFTEPMVGVWAGTTLRGLAAPEATPMHVGHFGAVAAAAALKAGVEADLVGYARGGWLYLPSAGRVRVPTIAEGRVRLRTAAGRVWVDGVGLDVAGPSWQARRTLTVGTGSPLTVQLEDLDPYRDAYQVPAADRLSDPELAEWRRRLAETWQTLTEFLPERAEELSAGLHSLVPLTTPTAGVTHSATATEAVGVVGLDLPRTSADFAVALVHEFQHSKLSALLDIVSLYDRSSRQTFFAPWRADPRPIGGLFQGVYAFIAVADVWRALNTRPDLFPAAAREFADARAQVADAIGTLDTSGLLTAPGRRFVDGMAEAVEKLHAVAVSPADEAAAQRAMADRRSSWLENHR